MIEMRRQDSGLQRERPLRVLVTGFGPFPGVLVNASELVVTALAADRRLPGIDLRTEIMPVIWDEASTALRRAIALHRPHALLQFGVSARARHFKIEMRAFNWSGPKEDHTGGVASRGRLKPNGKGVVHSTLPGEMLLRSLKSQGLPAELSADAGRYLCNALLYTGLHEAHGGMPLVGFVHIPAFGVPEAQPPEMSLRDAIEGARILVRSCAEAVLRHRHKVAAEANGKANGSQNGHRWRGGGRAVWRKRGHR